MKTYVARLYTASKLGPAQELLKIKTTSLNKAKAYAKFLAIDRNSRLVEVFENKNIGGI